MNNWRICWFSCIPLNAELNPICHLLALLGGASIVVVSRLRVNNGTQCVRTLCFLCTVYYPVNVINDKVKFNFECVHPVVFILMYLIYWLPSTQQTIGYNWFYNQFFVVLMVTNKSNTYLTWLIGVEE